MRGMGREIEEECVGRQVAAGVALWERMGCTSARCQKCSERRNRGIYSRVPANAPAQIDSCFQCRLVTI